MSVDTSREARIRIEDASYVVTPRVRSTARRLAFWIGAVVGILLLGILGLAIAGTATAGPRLSGTNAGDNGAKALVEVLRQNGVTAATPESLASAKRSLDAWGSSTTLVVYDQRDLLSARQYGELRALSDNIILIEPGDVALRALAKPVEPAGYANPGLTAGCSFGPAKRAGEVYGIGVGYRATHTTAAVTRCLPSGDGEYSLIRLTTGSRTVTVFGIGAALANDGITTEGNAALALGLFGRSKHLVWYLPSFEDVPRSSADVAAPTWVQPLIGLLALVLIAAAFWRGRRFGPLVVERLPVVVRSSETMEGRARLYQKSSSRTHALDALRMGTIDRIAGLCGLPRLATVTEVIGAVSTVTGRPAPALQALLVDELPRTDAQLARLSDQLALLEREVTTATRPGGRPRTQNERE